MMLTELVWFSALENIAHLAETALRFLELVQENNLNCEQDVNGDDAEESLHPNENYDSGTCLSVIYISIKTTEFQILIR